jgi:hypothetical protein
MEMRVINSRIFGDIMFFDLVLEDTFVIRGLALKNKRDGSGQYYQSPSKPRLEKVGRGQDGRTLYSITKGEDSYDIYESHFDLYGEGKGAEYKPTAEAFEGRGAIIELAVAERARLASGGASTGRGPAKAKTKAAAPAADADLPF